MPPTVSPTVSSTTSPAHLAQTQIQSPLIDDEFRQHFLKKQQQLRRKSQLIDKILNAPMNTQHKIVHTTASMVNYFQT